MIYENVKRLCEEHETNICKLEQACGIANGAIGKWKRDGASPRAETLKKIAEHFGCTVDDLLKEER